MVRNTCNHYDQPTTTEDSNNIVGYLCACLLSPVILLVAIRDGIREYKRIRATRR